MTAANILRERAENLRHFTPDDEVVRRAFEEKASELDKQADAIELGDYMQNRSVISIVAGLLALIALFVLASVR